MERKELLEVMEIGLIAPEDIDHWAMVRLTLKVFLPNSQNMDVMFGQ